MNDGLKPPQNIHNMLRISFLSCIIALSFFITSCSDTPEFSKLDQVHSVQLNQVRLGDGVPISLGLSIRWRMEKPHELLDQFNSPEAFSQSILTPRSLELVNAESNNFPSVDSVFSVHRQLFIAEMKNTLLENLGEPGILIKEIIVSNLRFPESYTLAMEKVGLQKQELERIRQQNILDIEQASANRKKAQADAEVQIAKAEADAKVQRIQVKTEKSRREIELAKAETQAQISKKEAQAEAERQRLLSKADLEKQRDLKNLEVQKQKDMMLVNIEKQRKLDKVEMERQLEMAQVYQENPVYASFVVNKELAGKVEIAVLPTGNDSNILGNFLNQTIQNKDGN